MWPGSLLGAGAPTAPALVAGERDRHVRRAARRVVAARGSSSSSCPARSVVVRGRPTRRVRDHVPGAPRAPGTCRCWPASTTPPSPRAGTPTAVVVAGGCDRAPATPTAARAPSRPRPADEHVGFDRFAEARAALAPQPRQQRPGDRRLPRPDAGRPRHHDAAAALLLRAVGPALPPRRRRRHRADRGLRRRPVLRGRDARRARSRTSPASRTRTSCSIGPGPTRCTSPSLRFMTQAGGRMAPERLRTWRERTAGWGVDLFVMYGQTEATARMAYLPPALAARHPGADRPADPRRPPRAAAGRRRGRRRRRARLPRPERHARLRHRRSATSRRGATLDELAHRRPRPLRRRRRRVRDRRSPVPLRQAVRPAHRPRRRRGEPRRRPASTPSRRATTTGSWCACPAATRTCDRRRRRGADRPAADGDRRSTPVTSRAAANGKVDYARLRRPQRRAAGDAPASGSRSVADVRDGARAAAT